MPKAATQDAIAIVYPQRSLTVAKIAPITAAIPTAPRLIGMRSAPRISVNETNKPMSGVAV